MYPIPSLKSSGKLIGRELTDAIDRLVLLRIQFAAGDTTPKLAEDIELTKRDITDALLAMDAREGIYCVE